MNSSKQTAVVVPSLLQINIIQMTDFCASDDISYCWKCVFICFI